MLELMDHSPFRGWNRTGACAQRLGRLVGFERALHDSTQLPQLTSRPSSWSQPTILSCVPTVTSRKAGHVQYCNSARVLSLQRACTRSPSRSPRSTTCTCKQPGDPGIDISLQLDTQEMKNVGFCEEFHCLTVPFLWVFTSVMCITSYIGDFG